MLKLGEIRCSIFSIQYSIFKREEILNNEQGIINVEVGYCYNSIFNIQYSIFDI